MSLFRSIRGPVPRFVKILRIWDRLHERHIHGDGDKLSRQRTLARWQKFDRMRREGCPSLIGYAL
jgi:hypothetical protein